MPSSKGATERYRLLIKVFNKIRPAIKQSGQGIAVRKKGKHRPVPSGMSSAVYGSCRMLIHRCLVSDGRHAVRTVWSTAQPSGQQWEHAESQVVPTEDLMCVRVLIWEPICCCICWIYLNAVRTVERGHAYGAWQAHVWCVCLCVCISSLVLIHLHSSCTQCCTHACFPQDGKSGKWKMMAEFLKERSAFMAAHENEEQSGRQQRGNVLIAVIVSLVHCSFFTLFLFTRHSLSLSLSLFNSLEDANPSGPLAPLHGMMSF